MADIPINLGGGSGSGFSDDCTATAADILESKTAIYDGSDDEAEYGSMKDYSGTTSAGTSSLDSTNSRVLLAVPNTGKYDTNSKLYQSYSNIASLIGLTASKIGTGNSILGISGSYTGVGTATASQVLSGYTFSNASGSGLSGSMSNYGGSTVSATASLDSSNSRVRMVVPSNGYYSTSSYLYTSYSNMRSLIGYTDASKVLSGTTILGLAGTMSDRSGTTSSATASLDSSNSRVRMAVPSNGYYNTSAYLYTSYSSMASLISLTAAKIATGNTILGISGSYTGVGTATASQVLSGYTFSNASSSGLSGSMSDRSGTTTSATSSLDSSNSRVRLQIPNNGYYNTSAYLYASYSNIASLIGLTAAKVVSGNTILGISGSAKEYKYSYYEYDTSTSAHSTETWVPDSGSSRSMRIFTLSDIGISDIGFTPQYIIIFGAENECTIAYENQSVLYGSVYGTYPASNNSQYTFSRTSIHIPFYYTTTLTAHVRIIGYT